MNPSAGFDIKKFWPLIAGAFLVVIVGVGSAWLISAKVINKGATVKSMSATGVNATANSAGSLDSSVKYDTATGSMLDGGIGDEGTEHLDRDGTPAHFVYLTSTQVDLSAFVGKKVEVWGQTLASKRAGWLMDVAKIQVVQ